MAVHFSIESSLLFNQKVFTFGFQMTYSGNILDKNVEPISESQLLAQKSPIFAGNCIPTQALR